MHNARQEIGVVKKESFDKRNRPINELNLMNFKSVFDFKKGQICKCSVFKLELPVILKHPIVSDVRSKRKSIQSQVNFIFEPSQAHFVSQMKFRVSLSLKNIKLDMTEHHR